MSECSCAGAREGEASAAAIVFDSVYLAGQWKKAGFYDMAGECCRFYNSFFETTAPNSFAVYYGPDNF